MDSLKFTSQWTVTESLISVSGKQATHFAITVSLPLTPRITVMRFENNIDLSRTRRNDVIYTYRRDLLNHSCPTTLFSC